jgi:hypothetical protein
MALPIEDTALRLAALAYVVALYEELTTENGAPTLGSQNQAVDFILADPQRRRAAAAWAVAAGIDEAATQSPRRLPQDAFYREVRGFLAGILAPPVFAGARQLPH